MSIKGIKSAIWSEYLNQFFNHKISEIPLFLHIQQGTESSFTDCISYVHLIREWWSGKSLFILVPNFSVLLSFNAHECEYGLSEKTFRRVIGRGCTKKVLFSPDCLPKITF